MGALVVGCLEGASEGEDTEGCRDGPDVGEAKLGESVVEEPVGDLEGLFVGTVVPGDEVGAENVGV